MALSLMWPFQNEDEIGLDSFGESDEEKRAAVKQNFRFLLLTRPGEYTMDIDFGVGIQRLLFQSHNTLGMPITEILRSETRESDFENIQGDLFTTSAASFGNAKNPIPTRTYAGPIARIKSQASKYMPYIDVGQVQVLTDNIDQNELVVRISYRINLNNFEEGTPDDIIDLIISAA